ncbi:MAG: hypothetical protein BWY78_01424 [Alphaproteobacteria bacterium ADurb.Bin438]|nr:MAG: hypothetical protein BWY78_01424 [Alphaproteobacteria bacterium ADurb.Bin438]
MIKKAIEKANSRAEQIRNLTEKHISKEKDVETKLGSSLLKDSEVDKAFETAREAVPTDMKRIVVPAFGFSGGTQTTRPEWGPDGQFDEQVTGLTFDNPKDGAKQVLKQKDGVIIFYDGPGRKEKTEDFLKKHPDTLKTSEGVKSFIDYLKANVVNDDGKADVWDTDTKFVSGLKDAPTIEDIKPGQVGAYVKKKEAVKAFYVNFGTEFKGPAGTPQIADKDGAYIVRDSDGNTRMVQKKEFLKAYEFPKTKIDPRLAKRGSNAK